VLYGDELVEPHGLMPREMEQEGVGLEVSVASRLLGVALTAYGDVLSPDHVLHRLVTQRAHLMHRVRMPMYGTYTTHA
tara:strand:+ start:498 stop:731 length:234 start_codon:yes stop_codon:yes gene_type:complete